MGIKLSCFWQHKPGVWLGLVDLRVWGESGGGFGDLGWGQMKRGLVDHDKKSVVCSKGNLFFCKQSSSFFFFFP